MIFLFLYHDGFDKKEKVSVQFTLRDFDGSFFSFHWKFNSFGIYFLDSTVVDRAEYFHEEI
jgi:hypothetical protein